MGKISMSLNKNNFLYLIICGGIILIIVLIGILPLSMKISNQGKENDKLTYRIKEQKDLSPVYQSLTDALKNKEEFPLPHREKSALMRSETGRFQSDFRAAAKKSGLTVDVFEPDINSSMLPSTSFLHHVVLRGELGGLRKMFIELGAMTYLDKIEDINIRPSATGGSLEMKMMVRIALK